MLPAVFVYGVDDRRGVTWWVVADGGEDGWSGLATIRGRELPLAYCKLLFFEALRPLPIQQHDRGPTQPTAGVRRYIIAPFEYFFSRSPSLQSSQIPNMFIFSIKINDRIYHPSCWSRPAHGSLAMHSQKGGSSLTTDPPTKVAGNPLFFLSFVGGLATSGCSKILKGFLLPPWDVPGTSRP